MRIVTTAPIPRVDQFRALFQGAGTAADESIVAAPWMLEGDTAVCFSRAAWGLAAILEAVNKRLARAPRLWLPDFFCNQTTWPARQTGVPITFYPIDDTLIPNWQLCDSMARSEPPDIFVLVHYFGYPTETADAQSFCKEHEAWLVEDAAHLLRPIGNVGANAHFVLHSLYKHLPVPDGGILTIRPSAQQIAADVLAAATQSIDNAPATSRWIAKRFVQSLAPAVATALSKTGTADFDEDPQLAALPPGRAMSKLARRMIVSAKTELDRIAEIRRTNEARIRSLFANTDDLNPLMPVTNNEIIPYRVVFRASSHDAARRWHSRIVASGNVVETWPDLAPEVKASPDRYQVALSLRDTLLALPINADQTTDALVHAYSGAL